MEDFLAKGIDYYNNAIQEAARGGHMEIVKLMISPPDFESSIEESKTRRKGANDYNEAMKTAARGGHMDPSRKRWAADPLVTCEVYVRLRCQ